MSDFNVKIPRKVSDELLAESESSDKMDPWVRKRIQKDSFS